MKKLILTLTLLCASTNTPALFANQETEQQAVNPTSTTQEKTKERKHPCCKKSDNLAQQLSMLRSEIETLEQGTSKENIDRLSGWTNYLEGRVLRKLRHAEANVAKYHAQLNEADISEDATVKAQEKITSNESKIETFQELQKIIDQLKTQLQAKA